jgi:hypothetical protein
MKIFLFLFFIAIISNNQKNESIEIIKCVLSNEKLKNDLNSLKFQIENLIKEGDYSNLISLLKIFSMVEEVKSCFKNPSQLINNEEIILKENETDFFECVHNTEDENFNFNIIDVQNCWEKLLLKDKIIIISAGADLVNTFCLNYFDGCENQEEFCSVIYQIVHSFEK